MPAVALLLCLVAAPTPPPHVVLLHSAYGDYRHRGDYDALLTGLGWPTEKVENTRFADLAPRLGEFDVVLGTALYNLGNPQDLLARRAEVVGWIERGGALLLTDTNYNEHLACLAGLGDGYAAEAVRCEVGGLPVTLPEPDHSLLNWPNRVKASATWSHMKLGPKWRVLARCADGSPIFAIAPLGRGFIQLSSTWPLSAYRLTNAWEYLRLRRAGVDRFAADGLDGFGPGNNRAKLRLDLAGTSPVPVRWHIQQPDGQLVTAQAVAREPHSALALTAKLSQRGTHRTWIEVGTDPLYTSAAREVRVPDAVEPLIVAPTYRGYLPLGLPKQSVRLSLTAYPFGEALEGARSTIALRQAGRTVAETSATPPMRQGQQTIVTLPYGKAVDGPCELLVTTTRGGHELARRSLPLRVLADSKPQVLLDEHQALRVDGQPFFPIGMYHVPDEALAEARAMGLNCHQAWGGPLDVSRRSLDAGQKAGMKVILEMSGFLRGNYQPEALRAVVRELKTHPALLAWYTVDEPAGEQHAWCLDAYRICREEDPNHPVFLVSCDPSQFANYTATTDILAIDPYPIDGAPVRMVADWCRTAVAAVADRQPYWLIPQLQNLTAYTDPTKGRGPTPAEEWCMVAQGLVHGARGVVYYPWNDGANGLTHEPALQKELPLINRLLAQIGPDLAVAERTLLTDAAQPDLHAATFAASPRLLVATNTGQKPVTLTLPAGRWSSLREARTLPGTVTLGALEVVVARAEK
ncbi:MAG: hypothetical protein HZB16_01805 [Armatimonadetes bacterium]|nr:hypothetical protein [Armatimonadota bacterium]